MLVIAFLYLGYNGYGPAANLFFAKASINRIVEDAGNGVVVLQTPAQAKRNTGKVINTRTGTVKTVTTKDVKSNKEALFNTALEQIKINNSNYKPLPPPTANNQPTTTVVQHSSSSVYCTIESNINNEKVTFAYRPGDEVYSRYDKINKTNLCRVCQPNGQFSKTASSCQKYKVGQQKCLFYIDPNRNALVTVKNAKDALNAPKGSLELRVLPDNNVKYCAYNSYNQYTTSICRVNAYGSAYLEQQTQLDPACK